MHMQIEEIPGWIEQAFSILAVFRIRDILVQIRILIRGSVQKNIFFSRFFAYNFLMLSFFKDKKT